MHQPPPITCAQQLLPIVAKHRLLPYGQTLVFYLDSNKYPVHQLLKKSLTPQSPTISANDLFKPALTYQTQYFIICHIRPFGIIKPSDSDLWLHDKATHIGNYLGIELLDYLIVNSKDYYSHKESLLLDKLSSNQLFQQLSSLRP